MELKSSRDVTFLKSILDGHVYALPYGVKEITLEDSDETYKVIGTYATTDPTKWLRKESLRHRYSSDYLEIMGIGLIVGDMQRYMERRFGIPPDNQSWSSEYSPDTNETDIVVWGYMSRSEEEEL